MVFVYRKRDEAELARLEGLGLKSPYGGGMARFGSSFAVDVDRGVTVAGLGGGLGETPDFWALVKDRETLILEGKIRPFAPPEGDRRLRVRVDYGFPKDSPLWDWPDLWLVLKEGLFMIITRSAPYQPGRILFMGGLGKRIEAA